MIADKIKNARTILYYITIIIVVLKCGETGKADEDGFSGG